MLTRALLIVAAAALAPSLFGFEGDEWAKVGKLKTGTELRVYKRSVSQPVLAQFGDTTDESLIVIVKNKQSSIPKEEIDRIDFRPSGGGKAEITTKNTTVDPPVTPKTPYESRVPGSSSSTSILTAGKPDFEPIYRRTASKSSAPK